MIHPGTIGFNNHLRLLSQFTTFLTFLSFGDKFYSDFGEELAFLFGWTIYYEFTLLSKLSPFSGKRAIFFAFLARFQIFKNQVGVPRVCHSCVSRNPGILIFRLWIPVSTGMTP